MNRFVIISHGRLGRAETIKAWIRPGDTVICADGGAEYAGKLDIVPQIVLGDFDSLPAEELAEMKSRGVRVIQFPVEKDATDTELAIEQAVAMGADEIVLLGASGSRLDHTFANLTLLIPLLHKGIRAYLVDEHNVVTLIKDQIELTGQPGDIVSLIPFTPKVTEVTTEGLYYPLQQATLKMGNSLGVSNKMIDKVAKVTIGGGHLLVFQSKD